MSRSFWYIFKGSTIMYKCQICSVKHAQSLSKTHFNKVTTLLHDAGLYRIQRNLVISRKWGLEGVSELSIKLRPDLSKRWQLTTDHWEVSFDSYK